MCPVILQMCEKHSTECVIEFTFIEELYPEG